MASIETYRVLGDQLGAAKRLLGQRFYRGLHCFLGSVGLGFELFVKKIFEFVDLRRRCVGAATWSLDCAQPCFILRFLLFSSICGFWCRS